MGRPQEVTQVRTKAGMRTIRLAYPGVDERGVGTLRGFEWEAYDRLVRNVIAIETEAFAARPAAPDSTEASTPEPDA